MAKEANYSSTPERSVEEDQGYLVPNWDQRGIMDEGYAIQQNYDDASKFVDNELQSFLQGTSRFSMNSIAPGGTYEFGSGSLSAPGIRWAADTDSGFYLPAAGQMDAVIGGVAITNWTASGFAIPAMTAGSVLFAGASGLVTQNNAGLFWDNSLTNLNLQQTSGAITFNSQEKYIFRSRNASITAYSIINPLHSILNYGSLDAVQGVIKVTNGSTTIQANAVAGYITCDSSSPTNAVALFGTAVGSRDSSHIWGLNTVCSDSDVRATGTGTGRTMEGYEVDFNVMNPATTITGVSLTGASLAQPTSAHGFRVATLGGGTVWTMGFMTDNGVCTTWGQIGASAASGANITSQAVNYNFFDSGSVERAYAVQVDNTGKFTLYSSTTCNFKVVSGGIYWDTQAFIPNGSVGTPGLTFLNSPTTGFYRRTGDVITLSTAGVDNFEFQGSTFAIGSATVMAWGNATTISSTSAFDVLLGRGSAGVLRQKDANNAQEFQVWGSSSLGVYLGLSNNGTNSFVIPAGGQIAFAAGALSTSATSGFMCVPSCGGAPSGVPASIPTAQIPQVVDTAGLTKWGYIGGAWVGLGGLIETGHKTWAIDNTYNLGGSATTLRPANGWFGTSVNVGAIHTITATGVVFNETGIDQDFRIEGDNKTSCLLLDASDDEVAIDGRLSLIDSTPAQITADQNDYVGAEGTATSRSTVWRISSDAARNITGIGNPLQGRVLTLINVGAQNIVIQNQNALSTAANRVITGTGADVTLAADDTMDLWYDSTSSRWRAL